MLREAFWKGAGTPVFSTTFFYQNVQREASGGLGRLREASWEANFEAQLRAAAHC